MKVTIRPMVEADLDTIVELEQQIFVDAWSRSSFEAELENKKISHPLVLEADGQIAGYAVVWSFYQELHIANFAIHPDFRKRGFGTQLLKYIFDRFKDAKIAFLEVRRSNEPAIRLYQKFGFKALTVRKRYYRDGEDALVMVKDLRN